MKFYYHPINTCLNFAIILCFYIIPIIFLLSSPPKLAIYIFLLILLIITGPFCFLMVNNFFRFLFNKAAVEITDEFYIDHLNGIKIAWNNINHIGTTNYGQWTFLNFDLIDQDIFYKQIHNPVQNIFFRLENFLTKTTFKTNISLVKGDNKEIFWTIFNRHKKYGIN